MKIIADTNAFLAVALNEPEKEWLIEATDGHDLMAPPVLPYEIGNALSSLARRKILVKREVAAAWDAATAIPVELAAIEVRQLCFWPSVSESMRTTRTSCSAHWKPSAHF